MKNKKIPLPETLITACRDYKVEQEDILCYGNIDINEDYFFSNDFILITKKHIIKALYPNDGSQYFDFGGYKINKNNSKERPSLFFYEINKDIKLNITREIGGGVLSLNDGSKEIFLCRFTNSRYSQFMNLKENLVKILEEKELTEEDIFGHKKMESCPKCNTLYPDQERKICPRCMDKKSIFIRVIKYFLPYKIKIFIMFLCYTGIAALNLIWPYLSGTVLYDKVLAKDEDFANFIGISQGRFAVLLLMVVATMFISKMLMQILGMIHGYMTAHIVPEVVAKIKQQVFSSMGRLSISFYNSKQTGGLMTRVLDDAREVTGFFIDGLPYFFTNVMTIIFTCIIMFRMNVLLSLSSLILLPFLTLASYKMMPRLWNFYSKRHRANRKLSSQINDNITGARVVKAFGQEETELKRFGKANKSVKNSELSVAGYDNRYYAMYTAVENIAAFTVWGLGGAMIVNGSGMEFGVLITFTGYVSQLNGPLDFMSFVFRWWTNSINAAQRIFEIIDSDPEIVEDSDPVRPEEIAGEIELKNISFSYDKHKTALKDVSFKIEKGKMLGIVGRSGAGKSTLVNLISRLYDPDEGNIYIDGINIKKMGFNELRKSIAMVSQETYIFMGTVSQNIAYARPDATMEEIIQAAVRSSCHDFICKMPDGYDTIIGSSGKTMSGGEKQRLSIARAILADPKILILDEATAAVDTETELAIQESIEKLVKGRTTISIAHRLSTLRNADKLIVIDEGKVVEEGTHRELNEKKGVYYKLMELQTKALAMRGIE